MKKTIMMLSLVVGLGLSSCDSTPNDKVQATKTELDGFKYDSTAKKQVQVSEEYVLISPTWGQSINYAKQTDEFWINLILGILALALAATLFVLKSKNSKLLPQSLDKIAIPLLFVLLAASLLCIYVKPGEIRWNNDKWVKKQNFDLVIKDSGSTKPIWDSLQNNCLIVGGSSDCYTK
jgi:hypothetical protein